MKCKENNQLFNLSKDIYNLWRISSNPKLEDVFIKIAQDYKTSLERWIKENQSHLEGVTSNPQTIPALRTLMDLSEEGVVNTGDLIKRFYNNQKYLHALPALLGMIQLLETDVEPLLNPFKGVLLGLASFRQEDGDDPRAIYNDLIVIKQQFDQRVEDDIGRSYEDNVPKRKIKLNRKEKQEALFRFMFYEFTKLIENHARSIKLDSLAKAIESGGLISPRKIVDKGGMELSSPSLFFKKRMDSLVMSIMKNIEPNQHELQFDIAKNAIMSAAGLVKDEVLEKFKEENESRLFEEHAKHDFFGTSEPSLLALNIEYGSYNWTNGVVVMLTSYFLKQLYNKIIAR